MKRKNNTLKLAATGALTALAVGSAAQAQSADPLLDKLVEKGILTVKEAAALKDETDKGFTTAYQLKSGMPDWVTSLKINGDFRGRFEGFYADNPAFVDRTRLRYRLRAGVIATMKDNFEVGFRLTSSEASGGFGGDPISGNTTFSGNGSKKFVYFDLAYAKWTQVNNATWTGVFTVGKMENPFALSDMVFDFNYTPEGAAQSFTYNLNTKHALKLNVGGFALREVSGSSNDGYLLGAQLRFDSTWSPKLQTALGVAALTIDGANALGSDQIPDQNRGNTRMDVSSTRTLAKYFFNPIVADAAVTYNLESFPGYKGAFPIKVAGEYMVNPAAPSQNKGYWAGVTFGKAGKKGLWEVSYQWKNLEADAWFEEFTDSDYGAFYQFAPPGGAAGYGAGTNVRGHIVKASYSPYDSLTLSVKYFLTELINPLPAGSNTGTPPFLGKPDSTMGRLQVDASWKF